MKKQEVFDQEQYANVNKKDGKKGVPAWVKILLLKYWTAGSVLYFFGFGLGALWNHNTDLDATFYLTLLLILGYCLINEYIVKPIVRLFRTSIVDTYYYNMVNIKGAKSFFLNLLYAIIVMVPVVIITVFLSAHGITLTITFQDGIDPFSFGLIVVFVDFIYLFIKNTIFNAYKKYKFNKSNKVEKDAEL